MPVFVVFSRYRGEAASAVRGPFNQVEMPHRRLIGDGQVLAVRGTEGGWRVGDDTLLDARIERVDGSRLKVVLDHAWDRGPETTRTVRAIRLYGDELADDAGAVAVADDDSRAWIDGSGRAFDHARAA